MTCPFCGWESRLTQFGSNYCIECANVKCLCRTKLSAVEGLVWEAWDKRYAAPADASMSHCPCCGGKPLHRVTQDYAQWYYVECGGCGLRHLATKTRSEAMQKWLVRHG